MDTTQNDPRFKINRVTVETTDCIPSVCEVADDISSALRGLEYTGTIGPRNSQQLDIHLEIALTKVLESAGWKSTPDPPLNHDRLAKDWVSLRADLLIWRSRHPNRKTVVEIEKSNKKTLWIDFIKLCAFLEADDIEAGLLVCPHNYAHATGEWDLYGEACRYKRALSFAGVSARKLKQIGIVGYRQFVERGGTYRCLNASELRKVKKRAMRDRRHL